MEIHTDGVDVFIGNVPADTPALASYGNGYHGIAWLEIDVGGGFKPVCRQCRGDNAWNPCDPANCSTACVDDRVRCVGTSLNALHVPLARGTTSTLSVRSVDLAGNVGDGASVVVRNSGIRPMVVGNGTQVSPRLYGNVLGYRIQGASSVVANRVMRLGVDRRSEGATSCAVGALGSGAVGLGGGADYGAWSIPGAPGLLFGDGTASPYQIKLRPIATSNYPCNNGSGDVTLYTLPNANTGLGRMALSGQTAAWFEFTPLSSPTTATLMVMEPGPDGLLETLGPLRTTLSYALTAPFNQAGHLQFGGSADYLLFQQAPYCAPGCAQTYNWKLLTRGADWDTGVAEHTFMVRFAALSPDGTRLVRVGANIKALEICEIGADGVWGPEAAGDCVTSPEVSLFTPDRWLLEIAGDRAVGIADSGLNQSAIFEWQAGPDGAFQSAGGGDDSIRNIYGTAQAMQDVDLNEGLLLFAQGDSDNADLIGFDLSNLRWEAAAASANYTFPVLNGKGHGLFRSALATNQIRARDPSGRETTTTLETSAYGGARALAATNKDLITVCCTSTSPPKVTVTHAGPDGVFFSGDTEAVRIYRSNTNHVFGSPAAADDKALILDRDIGAGLWKAFALEPKSFASLTNAGAVEVELGNAGTQVAAPTGGISKFVAAWTEDGFIMFRASVNQVFEATDPAERLKNASAVEYTGNTVRVAGTRIGFLDAAKTKVTLVARKAGLFNGGTEIVIPLPSGVIDWNMGGDQVTWIDGNFDVYVAGLATGVVNRISFHYSTKDNIVVDTGGRIAWEDALFPFRSVFSYAQ